VRVFLILEWMTQALKKLMIVGTKSIRNRNLCRYDSSGHFGNSEGQDNIYAIFRALVFAGE
jgi:hypothetical protein